MRAPSPVGTAINAARMRRWIGAFASYRHQVSEATITDWLNQFGTDRDVAARLLDVIDFYTTDRISAAFKTGLDALPGWNPDPALRNGKWRFAAMAKSAGESGDAMLHRFRVANRLDGARYSDLFIHPSQIALQDLKQDDTLVFVDDFVGTGDSVCGAWKSSFEELVPDVGRIYLIVVAAIGTARDVVSAKTAMTLLASHELQPGDNFFANENQHFTAREKAIVLARCRRAFSNQPKGYGSCGLVLSFQHRCPNNSIPVLYADHGRWMGLFPRHG